MAVALPVSTGLAAEEKHRTLPNIPMASLKEAAYWEPVPEKKMVRCTLCPNLCERKEHEVTACHTRIVKGGKLYTMVYSKPCVLSRDPLIKNPLYHVDPGAISIGTATAGCNLKCKYCQNWDVSQVGPEKTKNIGMTPAGLVAAAKKRNLKWLTFSYTEPTVYYEYALEAAKLAKKSGIKVAISSAGYICQKPLAELIKYVDAFSITLKGSTPEFYDSICKAKYEEIKRSIMQIAKARKWIEVVYLVVPTINDDTKSFETAAKVVAKMNIARTIPLHFLRFQPMYLLRNLPPTPMATLDRAYKTAKKVGLKYVYIDVSGHQASTTYCTKCKSPLLQRAGMKVVSNTLKPGGRCKKCGTKLHGIFS
jgi:pyruvate formate lyase activating enzyme